MARRIRERDWEETPLGPIGGWPENVVRAVNAILSSPNAVALLWGPDFRRLYNDRTDEFLGVEPAACLGEPIQKCWPEAWEMIQPWVHDLMDGRLACFRDQRLLVRRDGGSKEAWFDMTFSPVPVKGGTEAVLISVVETTDKVRAE